MTDGTKKTINIISYTLNALLAIALIIALKGGLDFWGESQEDVYSAIKQCVVEQELSRLPMTIQKLSDVNDIKIDSLVITNNVEPYQGYLVTQWKFDTWSRKGQKKQVLVEVTDIHVDDKTVSWKTNWLGASFSLL